ncbi:MAG: TerB family tellurite resistance protein [Pseudomonadota bacterium]
MLEKFQQFISGLASSLDGGPASTDADTHPGRTAASALMYHVIQADGVLRDIEKQRFKEVLTEEYGLSEQELESLVAAAKAADSEAVDFYRFTSVLMDMLDDEERVGFIEILWELVYADGYKHELEENVVWRISELLGVSGRDRVLMRQRVQERLGIHGSGEPFVPPADNSQ